MKAIALIAAILALCVFAVPAWAQEKSGEKPSTPDRDDARTELRVSVQERGLKFELHPDGKVELTIHEEDKATGKKSNKTYQADSLDQFKSKYPEIAKEHQIDRFVPRLRWGKLDQSSRKAWEEWKKWFEEDWFWDRGRDFGRWFRDWWTPFQSDDLDNWVEEQRKLFEKFRSLGQPRDPSSKVDKEGPTAGPAFGLRIAAVSEAVAAQLGLKEGEGVMVMNVREESPAQKAGLKKHDIILKLNGNVIADRGEFRRQISDLAGKEFELEILRRGQKETIKVKSEIK